MMEAVTDAGVKFSVIPCDRTEEVCQFLGCNFYPDEPIFRSVGLERNKIADAIVSEAIKEGSCVMATDSSGKIIGVWTRTLGSKREWTDSSLYLFLFLLN